MIKKILFCVLFFIISFASFGQTILGKPLINKATAKTAVNAGDINNIISYTNGNSNSVCVEANENTDATFAAPAGTYFDSVSFVSFGTPTGSACNYAINAACHEANSQSIVEDALLGKINTTIISVSNTLFGDPCGGTSKKLYVKAHYAEPLCAGGAVTIAGAASTETNAYTYLWESSTTSSTTGFGTATGTNNGQNYTTGVLTQDTWFRRKVITNSYTNISAVVLVKVNQRPTSVLSGGGISCDGEAIVLSVALTGTGPWDFTYSDGMTFTNETGILTSPYTFYVTPPNLYGTVYTIKALKDAKCTATAGGMTGNAIVYAEPRPTATLSGSVGTICSGDSTSFTISFIGSGPYDLTYTDGVTPVSITGIGVNPYTVNLTPTSSRTYSLIALKDSSCTATAADLTSSIIIRVNPKPTLTSATQSAPVCAGSAATIRLTGLAPNMSISASYTIDGVAKPTPISYFYGSGGTGGFQTSVLTAADNGKILKITGLRNTAQYPNCSQNFSMDVILVVNPDLTLGAASQETPVCEGSGAVIKLTGLLADSTSDITYTIAGVTQPTVTVVANSSGEASFTTLPLTTADNAQTLQITKSQFTVSPSCSKTFAVNTTLTVNQIPAITNVSQSIAACSGVGFTVTLVNGTNGVVPAGTTYSWSLPVVTGGLSGGATGSGATTITGNLVNATNTIQTATYTVTPKTGTCTGTPFTVTVSVNPTPTITAGTNANACQNSAMSTTLTLGDGITGATVTGLPTGITSSVSGNTLTVSGTPRDIGVFTYNVTTTGNSCNSATTSGTITVGGGNNIISYANGNSNSVCIEADENTDATFTAPAGTYFDTVSFASFGTPTGTACNYTVNPNCHQVNSQSIIENTLLGKTNTITIKVSNDIFGDPCGGTFKKLSATAHYSEPLCAGGTAGTITGSVPVETGAYTDLWESSTTSSTTGFGTAAGTNNGQNYSPGVLTQDTWFRRKVISTSCTNFSAVVLVKVNPRPTSVLTGSATICNGSTTNLSVALTGTGPWNLTYTDGTTPVSVTGVTANPYTISVNPSVQKNYTITALSDSNCTSNAADRTGSALIRVNPRPTSVLSGGGSTCDGTYRGLSVALTGTAPWEITYSDGTTSTTQAGVFTNPYIFYVSPASAKTYTITALKDSKCTAVAADMTGNAAVTVISRPTSIISGGGSVCYGDSSSFTITFTGVGPWDFSYSDGGAPVSFTGITTNPYTVNLTPVSSRIYRVTALKDSKCTAIAADMTGSAIISANPIPTLTGASVGGTVCAGSRAIIRLTGLLTSAVSVISYTIDGVPKPDATVATGSSTSTGGFSTVPLTAADNGKILRITGIKNTTQTPYCSQTFAVDVTLAVYPTLTLTGASQAAPVCAGSGAIINLTGLIPNNSYTTFYSIGGTAQNFLAVTANASGEASFTTAALTAANNNQTLEITRIQDVASPFCTQAVTKRLTLIVNTNTPSITTQSTASSICAGGNTSFTIAASGGGLTYQWQVSTNGGSTFTNLSDGGVYSNVTTATMNITGANDTMDTYQYQCVVTGTCSLFATSNPVILTVNPKLTNVVASVTLQPTCTAPIGTITVSNPLPASGLTYSLDGSNYTNSTGVFDNLSPGSYTVWVKNSSGCLMTTPAPIVVAIAGVKTWTGNNNNDWNDPANWNPVTATAPSDADCILIPDVSGFLNKPIVPAGNVGSAYAILIDNGGSVIVYGDATLKVTSSVTVAPTGLLEFMNNASLVQKTDVANTGNIIYHRTTTPVRRYDYTHWSSPVASSNFTLHTLSPNTLGDKYYSYDPVAGWVINYNGTLNMTPGMGYIVRAPQYYDINVAAIYPASFTGVPNNGTIEVSGIVASKWVLLGNPYPSAIFADEFMDLNHSGALYFWTHNSPPSSSVPGDGKYNYTNDDYAIYTYTGGVGIGDPGGSPTTPTGMIASGVAFFLNAGSSDNIVFTNDMREIGNNGQFFKTTKESLLEKNRIWLNMTNTGGAYKQVLVGYIEGASNNWDLNYDAVTINGNSYIDFYSINNTSKLTIQGRALPFDTTDRVPLGYKTTIAGEFTIAIDHADGILSNQAVYLEDKLTSAVQDLRIGNYTFTTATGTFADRFTISYTKKTLGTGDFEDLENSVLVSVKDKLIKVTSVKETISEVKIYDISGSLLYHKKKVGSNELQIQNLPSANQVLLVKVILENGYSTTKKIIFQ
jgi:hypothetical protein